MSGYRDRSNYDPYASPQYGQPMRPYNGVQWTGVALLVASIALNLAFLAGEVGWLPKWKFSPTLSTSPMIIGVMLINSRREQLADPSPELAPARRKWMLIVLVVCAVVFGTAIAISSLKGA
jgi:hypothetical protein